MKTCPSCGKKEGEHAPFAGSFCIECFSNQKNFFELKSPLVLEQCQKCERVKLQSTWLALDTALLKAFLGAKIKSPHKMSIASCQVKETGRHKLEAQATVNFEVAEYDAKISKKILAAITIVPTTCTECSQRSGGYYESIIQIRGDSTRLDKAVERIGRIVNQFSFISKIDVKKEGIDLYVGKDDAARRALSKLGWQYTRADKQAGARQGKTLYRRTYCVRL